MKLTFAESAIRDLKKLDSAQKRRILRKLRFFVSQKNPGRFADTIVDPHIGQLRFRIGDYRAICDMSKSKLTVLKVGHRKDIYR